MAFLVHTFSDFTFLWTGNSFSDYILISFVDAFDVIACKYPDQQIS
jgi:hypothetical protein